MKKGRNKPTKRNTARLRDSRLHAGSGIHLKSDRLTFIAHVHELRKRLFFIALSVGIFAGLAYSIEKTLTAWLLKPAAGQQFIYTTPGGGFDFLFKLCLYTGIAVSIPVIVYQLLRYIAPLFTYQGRRFMLGCTLWSSTLALIGIVFGYVVGLPAAMHFLLQEFSSEQISALITIQSYMSFVLAYLLGSALLFQLPFILLLINRAKPLQPGRLMKYQRWVIVGAFVAGAVVSPTPDIRNQALLSGPIILMYEVSLVLIWVTNRRHGRTPKLVSLLRQDNKLRAERQAKFSEARRAFQARTQPHPQLTRKPRLAPLSTMQTTQINTVEPEQAGLVSPVRPRRYVQDFSRPSYTVARRPVV